MAIFDPTREDDELRQQATSVPVPAGVSQGGAPQEQQQFMGAPSSAEELQERKKGWVEVIGELMSNPNTQQVLLQMAGQVAQPLQANESLFGRIAGAAGQGIGDFRQLEAGDASKAAAAAKALKEEERAVTKDKILKGNFLIASAKESRESGKKTPMILVGADGKPIQQVFTDSEQNVTDQDGNPVTIGEGEFLTSKIGSSFAEELGKAMGETISNLTKPTQTKLQKVLIGGRLNLDELDKIGNLFEDEYLNIFAGVKESVGKTLDKFGVIGDAINGIAQSFGADDLIKFAAQRREFVAQIDQFFNAYRKEITGAAAALAELKLLKQAMISDDLSPEQFRLVFNALRDKLIDIDIAHQATLKSEGILSKDREEFKESPLEPEGENEDLDALTLEELQKRRRDAVQGN